MYPYFLTIRYRYRKELVNSRMTAPINSSLQLVNWEKDAIEPDMFFGPHAKGREGFFILILRRIVRGNAEVAVENLIFEGRNFGQEGFVGIVATIRFEPSVLLFLA